MEVTNQIYPTEPGQMEKMKGPGPDGPIVMVNLLKFKDKAVYRDGRETDCKLTTKDLRGRPNDSK